ncbi:MAG: heavy metal-associated domain-containing protein [Candidatus Eisenbacteria bacterium]
MEPNGNRTARRFAAVLLGLGVVAVAGFVVLTASSQRSERRARGEAVVATAPVAASDSRIVRIDVDGMTCAGCAKTVETELRKVPGVTACRVDVSGSVAEVKLAISDVSDEALVAAIEDVGYKARLAPQPPSAP